MRKVLRLTSYRCRPIPASAVPIPFPELPVGALEEEVDPHISAVDAVCGRLPSGIADVAADEDNRFVRNQLAGVDPAPRPAVPLGLGRRVSRARAGGLLDSVSTKLETPKWAD